MITLRKSQERGNADHGWLKTFHTFSFAHYYDPKHMGFRDLRVINEDHVAAGQGFGKHPHDNMEIVTYIVKGALEHKDSMGNGSVIRPGDIQRMSAGTGVIHSEFNPSKDEPVHLLQIWILPERKELKPGYEEKHFDDSAKKNRLCLLVSPDGAQNSARINSDVRLYAAFLDAAKTLELPLSRGRHAWLQLISGEVDLNGQKLLAGDGASLSDETSVKIQATKNAEFLLFDLR